MARDCQSFNTFDFGTRFALAPPRHTLFRHLNLQKCSEPAALSAFSIPNVLRATTPCSVFIIFEFGMCLELLGDTVPSTFSTSQLPKVLGACGVFSFDSQMCFAPQRRAIFNFSPDGSALDALASPLFDPPESEPQNIPMFHDFPTFSRTWILFLHLSSDSLSLSLLTLPLLWLFPPLLFHLSILSEVWLRNFLRLVPSYKLTKMWKAHICKLFR